MGPTTALRVARHAELTPSIVAQLLDHLTGQPGAPAAQQVADVLLGRWLQHAGPDLTDDDLAGLVAAVTRQCLNALLAGASSARHLRARHLVVQEVINRSRALGVRPPDDEQGVELATLLRKRGTQLRHVIGPAELLALPLRLCPCQQHARDVLQAVDSPLPSLRALRDPALAQFEPERRWRTGHALPAGDDDRWHDEHGARKVLQALARDPLGWAQRRGGLFTGTDGGLFTRALAALRDEPVTIPTHTRSVSWDQQGQLVTDDQGALQPLARLLVGALSFAWAEALQAGQAHPPVLLDQLDAVTALLDAAESAERTRLARFDQDGWDRLARLVEQAQSPLRLDAKAAATTLHDLLGHGEAGLRFAAELLLERPDLTEGRRVRHRDDQLGAWLSGECPDDPRLPALLATSTPLARSVLGTGPLSEAVLDEIAAWLTGRGVGGGVAGPGVDADELLVLLASRRPSHAWRLVPSADLQALADDPDSGNAVQRLALQHLCQAMADSPTVAALFDDHAGTVGELLELAGAVSRETAQPQG